MLIVIIGHDFLDIATAILAFFVLNLMLFLIAYVLQKVCMEMYNMAVVISLSLSLQLWYLETITALPIALVAVVVSLWGVAFYFFILKASTNWVESGCGLSKWVWF